MEVFVLFVLTRILNGVFNTAVNGGVIVEECKPPPNELRTNSGPVKIPSFPGDKGTCPSC